jgi:AGZA family xanthine/uracil permease-like MFS transporter
MAALVTMFVGRIFGDPALRENGIGLSTLKDATLRHDLLTVRVLSAGFIVTSLLWASIIAFAWRHCSPRSLPPRRYSV